MNKNFRNRTVALATILVFLVLGACDKTTTNITQVIMPGDEANNDSLYYNTDWLMNVKAFNFIGNADTNHLYPSYILQTEGLRCLYADSPFARQEINNSIMLFVKNPGVGNKLTISMSESDISEEFTGTYVVTDIFANIDTLVFDFPVIWKHEVLCQWRRDKLVNLRWEIRVNDVLADTDFRTFTCHSINEVAFNAIINKAEEPRKYAYFAKVDFGNFPHWKDDEKIIIYLNELIAGYIDENSPLIERMRRELIEDGYAQSINGSAASSEEELLNDIKGFSYLLQKHRVTYGMRSASTKQYVRGIDEVFANQNGYSPELTAAFVSWCVNLGIDTWIYNVPQHMYPIVASGDGSPYPWDPTLLCYQFENFPDLKVLTKENREEADKLFENVARSSSDYYKQDLANEKESPMLFHTVNVRKMRRYLPSFNASEGHFLRKLNGKRNNLEIKADWKDKN